MFRQCDEALPSHLAKISVPRAYRKAYDGGGDGVPKVGSSHGSYNPGKTMTSLYGSPTGSSGGLYLHESSLALLQPRHKNRPTAVQRLKVLRDRNKNLPKLDFSAKANGIPKKFQGAPSFSRSYTYDSMKLPSISTCSVVTGVSGKSVQSDGYRRKDKKSIQENSVTSGSYIDLTQDINNNLSKSLQSLDERASSGEKAGGSKHRYERITYQKHLSNRRRSSNKGYQKEPTLLNMDNTTLAPQSDRTSNRHKDNSERQFVYVKNHRKEKQDFPHIFDTLKREADLKAKKDKNPCAYGSPASYLNGTIPSSLEARSIPETLTLTPDDVTIKSPPTTGVCSPKSTITLSSPAQPINISVYDAELLAID